MVIILFFMTSYNSFAPDPRNRLLLDVHVDGGFIQQSLIRSIWKLIFYSHSIWSPNLTCTSLTEQVHLDIRRKKMFFVSSNIAKKIRYGRLA